MVAQRTRRNPDWVEWAMITETFAHPLRPLRFSGLTGLENHAMLSKIFEVSSLQQESASADCGHRPGFDSPQRLTHTISPCAVI